MEQSPSLSRLDFLVLKYIRRFNNDRNCNLNGLNFLIKERRSPTAYSVQEPPNRDRISPQNPFGSPDSGESLSKFYHSNTCLVSGECIMYMAWVLVLVRVKKLSQMCFFLYILTFWEL